MKIDHGIRGEIMDLDIQTPQGGVLSCAVTFLTFLLRFSERLDWTHPSMIPLRDVTLAVPPFQVIKSA